MRLAVCLICLLLQASMSMAATYYIDPISGSNSNDGLSEGAPRLTAPEPFTNGDTYLWKRGTAQVITGGRNTTRHDCVIGAYGTGDKPILSDPGGYVLSFGTGAYNWTIRDIHFQYASYGIQNATGNTLDGLIIENCQFDNITNSAIRLNYTGSITIRNCQFRNIASTTCNLYANTNSSTNAYYDTNNPGYAYVHHCYFKDVGTSGTGNIDVISIKGTGLIEDCVIENQLGSNGSGIDIAHTYGVGASSPTVTVQRIVMKTGEGHGFGCNSESSNSQWARVQNCFVVGFKDGAYIYGYGRSDWYNNTFVNCTTYGIRAGIDDETDYRTVNIYNNIFAGEVTIRVGFCSNNANMVYACDYNSYYSPTGQLNLYWGATGYDSLSSWQGATPFDDHTITSNPLLRGYYLSSTSPCIGAGTALTTTDILGVARPVGTAHDIGCLEYRPAGHYGAGLVGVGVQ